MGGLAVTGCGTAVTGGEVTNGTTSGVVCDVVGVSLTNRNLLDKAVDMIMSSIHRISNVVGDGPAVTHTTIPVLSELACPRS